MNEFVVVKTADLSREALNWAVAEAAGLTPYLTGPHYGNPHRVMVRYTPEGCSFEQETRYRPSTDWSRGGPLIERLLVTVTGSDDESSEGDNWRWGAAINDHPNSPAEHWEQGPTPLIAACRAIVASVLGETVSVPKELCHG